MFYLYFLVMLINHHEYKCLKKLQKFCNVTLGLLTIKLPYHKKVIFSIIIILFKFDNFIFIFLV